MQQYGHSDFRGMDVSLPGPMDLARQGVKGRDWYARARASIEAYAARHGFTVPCVCSILAITSPRVHVSRNVAMADHYLRHGTYPPGSMPLVRRSLDRYEATKTFGGIKSNAFARALWGDPNAVVVDVWMIRAFGRGDWPSMTDRRYRRIAGWIRGIATRLDWPAAEAQAAIWTGCRSQYGYTHGDLVMPD